MIPILYKADAVDFSTFGIGALSECTLCEVTEERNGAFECTLKYPVTGRLFAELKNERLIKAKPNDTSKEQLFRIYRITTPINGIVTINAQHISYDLSNIAELMWSSALISPSLAMSRLFTKTATTHNFKCSTDFSSAKPASNDNRAITIEVASDTFEPYKVNNAAYKSLIKLLVDICKRNGIKKLVWSTNKSERMNHLNGCNMTVHRDYANKSCPGDYLYNLHGQIAKEVNAQLGLGTSSTATTVKKTLYRVRKTWKDVKSQKGAFNDLSNAKKCADENKGYSVFDESGKAIYTSKAANSTSSFKVQIAISDLNIRKGPGTNYATTGKFTGKGVFTIVETKQGTGSDKGWGKLKSGAGWIALDYATKI